MTTRTTRQRRPCCFDRVELIRLAIATTFLTVRTINLDHRHTRRGKVACQTCAVSAGAFHPDPLEHPEGAQPPRQLVTAIRRRRERLHPQQRAVEVDRSRDMHIKVRVNTTDDRTRGLYDGHRHPFSR